MGKPGDQAPGVGIYGQNDALGVDRRLCRSGEPTRRRPVQVQDRAVLEDMRARRLGRERKAARICDRVQDAAGPVDPAAEIPFDPGQSCNLVAAKILGRAVQRPPLLCPGPN